jgi:hypothetical protein
VDPLRHGPSTSFALSLYQEAAFWALLAQDDALEATSLPEAFALSDQELLLSAVQSPEDLPVLRSALCDRDFIATAEIPLAQQQHEAQLVSRFLRALLSRTDKNEQAIQRLLLERWLRLASLLLLTAGLTTSVILGASRLTKKQNLAAGKPWRTSSIGMTCYPQQHRCGTARTDILFHTQEEENPWFELDLRAPTEFSIVEVFNRSDCCPDRAIPIAIEISNDKQNWKEIARREETFGTWTARVGKQKTRYIRLKSLRRTTLHLEGIAVR